jgi:hypothetical protein
VPFIYFHLFPQHVAKIPQTPVAGIFFYRMGEEIAKILPI